MVEFTDSERAYLAELRAITKDAEGRDTLIGLTVEESAFYVSYAKRNLSGTHSSGVHGRDDQKRYLELHGRHERARHQILAAENALRNDDLTRQ